MARNASGVIWILAAAVTFTLGMSLVKFLGGTYSAPVQTFYRQLVQIIVLAPFILRSRTPVFKTSRPWTMFTRSAANSLSLILGYTSYQLLALADANALSFTRTLWMVPLAMLVLKSRIDFKRIGATIFGFMGVLIILRPGAANSLIGLPALYGLGAAGFGAYAIIGVKSMSSSHTQLSLLSWSALLGLIFASPLMFWEWRVPDLRDLLLLAAMGGLGVVTQACYIRGMMMGDPSVLAPLDYTRIIFSSLFGLLFFAEVPGVSTLAGAAVIIISAIYITMSASTAARAVAVIK